MASSVSSTSEVTRNLITGTLINANGTDEQKKRLMPKIARGELMTAAAFTEPDSGSDTASFKTRAVKNGDGYLIKGSKMWCTFANRANVLTVMVRTDPDISKRHKGLSLLLFEKTPGDDFAPPHLTGSPIPTIGYHGMRSYALQFEDAYSPASNLVGGVEGRGFYQLMASYESARIQTAARGVGVAQAAFETAVKYAKQRTQFGQPIGEHQVIRHKLAHMAVEIEAARQLAYFAASQKTVASGDLRGRTRESVRRRDGGAGDARRDANPRRLRLFDGVRGAALLARCARAVDFRRHHRDRGSRSSASASWSAKAKHHASHRRDNNYFEDFTVGDTLIHQRGRTITENDNHMFTSMVMNTNELHFNQAMIDPES